MAKPWLTENHSQEFADAIADACLNQYQALPNSGKPSVKGTKHEWTILAGICLVQHAALGHSNSAKQKSNQKDITIDNERYQISVVALGTGLKCLPLSKLSQRGDAVQDSHAEVITRRGFIKYLLDEVASYNAEQPSIFEPVDEKSRKLRVKSSYTFHMYISQAPCGDASMTELEAIQSKESLLAHMEGKKRKATDQEVECNSLSLYTYKFKRQKLHKKSDDIPEGNDFETTTVRRGRVGYQEFGILRTKPGRVDSEPTLSMSCSDKLARWNVLGLQSALLAMIIDPVYLDSVIVNQMFDLQALQRALYGRLSNLPTLESPYRRNQPRILHTERQYSCSKQILETKVPASDVITCNTSIEWVLGMPKCEVIVNGRRQGAPKPKNGQYDLKSSPSATNWVYQDVKSKAVDYNAAKSALLENCFQDWVQTPEDMYLFDLEGIITSHT
ncbi:hypothetical protein K450DRAFT_228464 [Umbelopsis ramanniana AG]|uniref:A to I editase domain-containing protein n=1 Tax=Umbelopsis ramanniana AG TaxID=1314678 RepID=A0AAD5EEQ3_UMBRA|nr:uncharacterized protein K450DRAFT_228464 [Umbelopsis ramanniana AG]KAI8582323.1 hypothetical protein K450DRAFT_228464 [Umbelopsis ramanniana AG]